MIKSEPIAQILSLYRKHGWTLRRVLLSPPLQTALEDSLADLFGEAPVIASEIDAVWFSRTSRPGQEAWELRRLSETPFALFETFDAEDDEEVREEARAEMESRLKTSSN